MGCRWSRSYAEIMVVGTPARSASSLWLSPLLSRASWSSPAAAEGASYECVMTQLYHSFETLDVGS